MHTAGSLPAGPEPSDRRHAPSCAFLEHLEPRLLLSSWFIEGHIGGADWVGGVGAGFVGGSALGISGSFGGGDWRVGFGLGPGGGAAALPPPANGQTPSAPETSAPASGEAPAPAQPDNPAPVSALEAGRVARLADPGPDVAVERGSTYRVRWTGGESGSLVGVWRFSPAGWQHTADIPADQGACYWDTSGAGGGWHFFASRTELDGEQSALDSAGWFRVTDPVGALPALELTSPEAPVTVARGEHSFELTWEADIPVDLTLSLHLEAYSEDGGRIEIAAGLDPHSGSFWWNTSAVAPGQYRLLGRLGSGDLWVTAIGDHTIQVL